MENQTKTTENKINNQIQNQANDQATVGAKNLQQNSNAGQKGIHEPGTGLADPKLKKTNQGTEQGVGQDAQNKNERAISRRSRVANSVQAMEKIANRNGGIGEQVRVIAQNQNRIQAEAEGALETAQKRSGFAKFFIGPNYKQLKTVGERLENHTKNLEGLKELKDQLLYSADKTSLDEQIKIMEEIKQELEDEIAENEKGISLFGWLSKLLVK